MVSLNLLNGFFLFDRYLTGGGFWAEFSLGRKSGWGGLDYIKTAKSDVFCQFYTFCLLEIGLGISWKTRKNSKELEF